MTFREELNSVLRSEKVTNTLLLVLLFLVSCILFPGLFWAVIILCAASFVYGKYMEYNYKTKSKGNYRGPDRPAY